MIEKNVRPIALFSREAGMTFKWCVALWVVVALSACQTTPKRQVEPDAVWQTQASIFKQRYQNHSDLAQWRYSAKVGVVTSDGAEQANMIWVFDNQRRNTVRLFGPFGLGAIKIEFNENSVVLSDRKGVLHQGHSAQELLKEIAGLSIPVDALHYWLFSLPLPQKEYDYQLNEEQQLTVLRQLGWVINYSNYRDYFQGDMHLARKIVAKKHMKSGQEVSVTLVAKTWKQ